MDTMIMDNLAIPVARYRFEWEVQTVIKLPEYSGSVLRGVFGAALRMISCRRDYESCLECELQLGCPYATIFETPPLAMEEEPLLTLVVPNPYVIEPPAWGSCCFAVGEPFVFHMVLAGSALLQLPLIIFVWQKAMSRGIGYDRGVAVLRRVVLVKQEGEEEILGPSSEVIVDHDPVVMIPPWSHGREITLHLQTPTRIQRQKTPLRPEIIVPSDLLIALIRRISQVAKIHCGINIIADYNELASQASQIAGQAQLQWWDWKRHSFRQQQTMILGGIVGKWTMMGCMEPFWPYLYLGEWLHVGKNATFGLGHYRLENKGV